MHPLAKLKLVALSACAILPLAACTGRGDAPSPVPPSAPAALVATAVATPVSEQPLPRLVDLGATSCIPCKAMAPILEQLRADYAGKLRVDFIDVWKRPEAAEPYKIQVIPTQIFYAADGRELARHEGFIGRDAILAQWKTLGISL
jgi:thioredoxin 1